MATATAEAPPKALTPDDLPAELRGSLEPLQEALVKTVPAEWPGDSKYVSAVQPEAIALALKQAGLHDSLSSAHIAYLFRKECKFLGRNIRSRSAIISLAGDAGYWSASWPS